MDADVRTSRVTREAAWWVTALGRATTRSPFSSPPRGPSCEPPIGVPGPSLRRRLHHGPRSSFFSSGFLVSCVPPSPPPTPTPVVFLGLPCSSTSREYSLARGGRVRDPLWGTCLWRERWLIYLERKTEVGEVATVAWAWTLAPLPLLGARVQTAAGSALTVFYVGFETRPRGKQREFLLRRKAARCFQLPWIGMESLERENGWRGGGPT